MAKKKFKLTSKKNKWVGKRTTNLKGKPLVSNISIANRYQKKVDKLIDAMAKETQREILALFKTKDAEVVVGMDASITSQLRILVNALSRKWDRVFAENAKVIAKGWSKSVDRYSEKTLKSSLEHLSGGLTIDSVGYTAQLREVIAASVDENVDLIKTISSTFLDDVKGDVLRSIKDKESGGLSGLRERIHKKLNARYKRQRNKAKNIALDQTRKLYNDINASRMQKVGVKEFEWHHSGGSQNPREDHIEMDGNVYSFDDLPVIDKRTGERGIPGQAINCKCYMTPVIRFESGEEQ